MRGVSPMGVTSALPELLDPVPSRELPAVCVCVAYI